MFDVLHVLLAEQPSHILIIDPHLGIHEFLFIAYWHHFLFVKFECFLDVLGDYYFAGSDLSLFAFGTVSLLLADRARQGVLVVYTLAATEGSIF